MSEFSESYHLRSERAEDAIGLLRLAKRNGHVYQPDWENEITADDSRYSREALQRLVPPAEPSLIDEFERRSHPKGFDELLEVNASTLLAQALGLEHYEWLSYDYIASDSPDDHPDVTEVT